MGDAAALPPESGRAVVGDPSIVKSVTDLPIEA
jgi:hypothetical protein